MSLSEKLQAELAPAMKAKERTRVGVIRLIKAAVKNKEIEKGGSLSTAEENQILQTMVKQRIESIEQFEKGGRSDLAEKEAEEKELILAYLPEAVSEDEIERIAVEELAASSPKDMGRVMKETMARLKDLSKPVDGKAVNAVVRTKLS